MILLPAADPGSGALRSSPEYAIAGRSHCRAQRSSPPDRGTGARAGRLGKYESWMAILRASGSLLTVQHVASPVFGEVLTMIGQRLKKIAVARIDAYELQRIGVIYSD